MMHVEQVPSYHSPFQTWRVAKAFRDGRAFVWFITGSIGKREAIDRAKAEWRAIRRAERGRA